MQEAGGFAGYQSNIRSSITGEQPQDQFWSGRGSPFDTLSSVFSLLTSSVTVCTQIWLLLRTLSGGPTALLELGMNKKAHRGGGRPRTRKSPIDNLAQISPGKNTDTGIFSSSTLILIALSFLPSAVRLVGDWFTVKRDRATMREYYKQVHDRDVKALVRSGVYKQELVLFGLKDWVLKIWDSQIKGEINLEDHARRDLKGFTVGVSVVQQGVENLFYVSCQARCRLKLTL